MKAIYFFVAIMLMFSGACTIDAVEDNTDGEELTEDVNDNSDEEENNDDQDDGSNEDEENNEDENDDSNDDIDDDNASYVGNVFIAGHEVAKESVLRRIPVEYIDKARNSFRVAYQHTSHGTHVTRGVFGLPDYKSGDDVTFGVSLDTPVSGKLTIYDYAMQDYAPAGEKSVDLSEDEESFLQTTRNFLDDPQNADVNVIMWSWCDISNHDVEGTYLPGMKQLIEEYGVGGSKIGTGEGQREVPVHFIFMTGHAIINNNLGEGRPKNQADLINEFCQENNQFCLDYYSIDTHDMDGNYWDDASDNGYSDKYGGNFYVEWQEEHTLGEDYWENRKEPGGTVVYGSHNTQHITSNRKAMAFWWILARLAGWDGELE